MSYKFEDLPSYVALTGPEPVEYRGEVPPRSVVVPGTRPRAFAAGQYGLPCGLIIGRRGERTESKLRLNETLREFGWLSATTMVACALGDLLLLPALLVRLRL